MPGQLSISLGQYSDKGRKQINQDFHGAYVPEEPRLSAKGIAVALADGIGSSEVSQIASAAAVTGFLEDYFSTPDAWSVKKSAQQVLSATNAWLYSQTRQSRYRYDQDRGYICTFSALILKSTTVYLFHIGDARIYRLQGNGLEQLTDDHRLWVSQDKSYLSRALGIGPHLEIDYQALPLDRSDCFLLMTDGVYEYVGERFIVDTLAQDDADLDTAAQTIAAEAHKQGSPDNLTAQIVRVEALPLNNADELHARLTELPLPPLLTAGRIFDGYRIVREIHASYRSHVYLAIDRETQMPVAIKIPSIDLRIDPAYLERFSMEAWIARRIDSPHVLKSIEPTRKRNYFYHVTEFIEGRTLSQWMIDHPKPELEKVRGIIEQIARGLRAFHRLEMVHQDLRPDNIMIDGIGTVKLIDFGSTKVAGIAEIVSPDEHCELLGTAPYTAPEYFLGQSGTPRSDLYSLGVICYQMLTGKLPYGTQVAKCRSRAAQNRLIYRSIPHHESKIPAWVDEAIRKAVHPDPNRRYEELSEFIHDLRHPNQAFLNKTRPPLIERDPLAFWKGVTLILSLIVAALLIRC
ncbi:bifunctional protein-serine/threonine kinase/phosphatase [Methylohalobius crimeensis]|uniref:bifunctional protein-serine/threonine kinase/phosphatase n=1 Tax=Methylohalobius crimeensis TaxID=244365 RepID=UPI0003B4BD27|nr:bifunctional protein-serine/threonine kinase/phosphatase [Methylohalobius crimeensis]